MKGIHNLTLDSPYNRNNHLPSLSSLKTEYFGDESDSEQQHRILQYESPSRHNNFNYNYNYNHSYNHTYNHSPTKVDHLTVTPIGAVPVPKRREVKITRGRGSRSVEHDHRKNSKNINSINNNNNNNKPNYRKYGSWHASNADMKDMSESSAELLDIRIATLQQHHQQHRQQENKSPLRQASTSHSHTSTYSLLSVGDISMSSQDDETQNEGSNTHTIGNTNTNTNTKAKKKLKFYHYKPTKRRNRRKKRRRRRSSTQRRMMKNRHQRSYAGLKDRPTMKYDPRPKSNPLTNNGENINSNNLDIDDPLGYRLDREPFDGYIGNIETESSSNDEIHKDSDLDSDDMTDVLKNIHHLKLYVKSPTRISDSDIPPAFSFSGSSNSSDNCDSSHSNDDSKKKQSLQIPPKQVAAAKKKSKNSIGRIGKKYKNTKNKHQRVDSNSSATRGHSRLHSQSYSHSHSHSNSNSRSLSHSNRMFLTDLSDAHSIMSDDTVDTNADISEELTRMKAKLLTEKTPEHDINDSLKEDEVTLFSPLGYQELNLTVSRDDHTNTNTNTNTSSLTKSKHQSKSANSLEKSKTNKQNDKQTDSNPKSNTNKSELNSQSMDLPTRLSKRLDKYEKYNRFDQYSKGYSEDDDDDSDSFDDRYQSKFKNPKCVCIIPNAVDTLGRNIAKQMARDGNYKLVLLGNNLNLLRKTYSKCRNINGMIEVLICECDIYDRIQFRCVLNHTLKKFKAIHMIIQYSNVTSYAPVLDSDSPGQISSETINEKFNLSKDHIVNIQRAIKEEKTLEKWQNDINSNLVSCLSLTKMVAPHIRDTAKKSINKYGGNVRDAATNEPTGILFVSSIASKQSAYGLASYCASHHGLIGFANSLFEEMRQYGTKVCTIIPDDLSVNLVESRINGSINSSGGSGGSGINSNNSSSGSNYTDSKKSKMYRRLGRLTKEDMINMENICRTIEFISTFPGNACPTEIVIKTQAPPKRI